jgi:hypothetical protein
VTLALPILATHSDEVQLEPVGQTLVHEPHALLSFVRLTHLVAHAVRGD